jgi:hypothetical protein
MKFPNHIVLDINKPYIKNSEQYWVLSYLPKTKNFSFFNGTLRTLERFRNKRTKLVTSRFRHEERFTFVHNFTNKTFLLSADVKTYYLTAFASRPKVINKLLLSRHVGKKIYQDMKKKKLINLNLIKILITRTSRRFKNLNTKGNLLWKTFDINFLKKEHLYTKLKYSRTPQYDMVSGGAAALFAGFLGFLICEKFGLELLDSGDFYFLFMYLVFFFFFLKLIFKNVSSENKIWSVISYKWFYVFYRNLITLWLNRIFNK